MSDYRTFYDKQHIGAWDLGGREVVVVIEAVKGGKVGHGEKASKKPIIKFRGKEKTLACNITNAGTIAKLYGNDTREWIGKAITLYPTTTTFGRETVDCVRVKPQFPKGKERQGDFEQPDPSTRAAMQSRQDRAAGRDSGGDDGGEQPNDGADEESAEERRRRIEAGEDPNDA